MASSELASKYYVDALHMCCETQRAPSCGSSINLRGHSSQLVSALCWSENLISSSSYVSYLTAMLLFILHSYNFSLVSCNDNRFVETVRHACSFIRNTKDGMFLWTSCSGSVVRVCVCVCHRARTLLNIKMQIPHWWKTTMKTQSDMVQIT